MSVEAAPKRPGLLRSTATLVWWRWHLWFWVRWHGRKFRCPACGHGFWAIPAQHGFANACPLCLAEVDHAR
jgi:rubrerythrin